MVKKLYSADANEISRVTGCLARCDTFRYTIKEHRSLQQSRNAWTNNTLDLAFWFLSGEHEVREQVSCAAIITVQSYTSGHLTHKNSFQYIIYDGNSFVADVGGYLGLLVGQSFYGLYDVLGTLAKNGLDNYMLPK